MVKDSNDGHEYRVCVDEEWYLQEYPDVAAAGFTAAYHYETHGRQEGRLPKPLLSQALERKLWSGFSRYALIELNTLFRDEYSDHDERMFSALALARWHASRSEWETAADFANYITGKKSIASYLKHEGAEVIAANIHIKTKNFASAKIAIENMDLSIVSETDQLLLVANMLTASSVDSSGPLALGPINKIYEKAHLSQFDVTRSTSKASLENLAFMKPYFKLRKPHKISVIMPAYNAENNIELALNGILKQSWINLEVIVVDDASNDNTAEIVSRISRKDARVQLIRHDVRQGAYAARNTAWRAATGEFITNHDSDDWSHPQKFELLIKPLLADPSIILSMCSWVRVDNDFLFVKPRPDLKLIHPSISTSMMRLDVLQKINGWDEVRVAADSELLDRIRAIYGQSAINVVLPQTPLVFSRELENSLTTSPDTHWSSEYFGLRDLYKQCYEHWHKLITQDPTPLTIKSGADEARAFFTPAMNLLPNCERQYFDLVIYADLNDHSPQTIVLTELIKKISKTAVKFAIFHWPNYEKYKHNRICLNYIRMAQEGIYDLLTPGQSVSAEYLALIGNGNFSYHPDRIPLVHFKKIISLSDSSHVDGIFTETHNSVLHNFPHQLKSSGIFDPDWYLSLYPDVRNSKVSPFEHFIQYGFKEGRSPSPAINAEYYKERYLSPRNISSPALLHYLNKGRHLGYTINNPILGGMLKLDLSKPSILACAHASDATIFGAERNFFDIIKTMSHSGYNVIVVLPRFANLGYIDSIRKISTSLYFIPYPLWSQSPFPNQWSIKQLEQIILNESIDAVYSNTLMLREPLIAAKNLNIPSLCHAHEVFEPTDEICITHKITPAGIYGEVDNLATQILANSQFTADCLGVRPDSLSVIPNSINVDDFINDHCINPANIKIGLISSNIEKKGLSDFFTLAGMLENVTKNARFCIIGPPTSHLEHHLRTAPSNINYLGYINSSVEAISELDIVLNLSTCQETFGRTILEGMAAEKVVLAYDRGALPELIDNSITGFTVPYKDLKKAAEIIKVLCANTDLIKNIGRKAKARAELMFAERVIQKKIKTTLEQLLKN